MRVVKQALFLVALLIGLARVFGPGHALPGHAANATGASQFESVDSGPSDSATAQAPSPWDKTPVAATTRSSGPGEPQSAFAQALTVERDEQGRFHLDGEVNGRNATLLVDTGADVVAIPASEAAGFGIPVQPDEFRPILRTASGTAMGAPVRVNTLTLGSTTLRDVDAVVVQDLDVILLGQSALRRFGRVEIAGDRMVLHPS
jgi:aspartyl protease family protein